MKKTVIILLCILFVLPLAACGGDQWPTTGLGAMLPTPSSGNIKVISNDDDFYATVDKAKEDEFTKYVAACEEMGFTIDEEKDGASFNAFNQDGYHLDISAFSYNNSMWIKMDSPIEIGTLRWPSGEIGKLIPQPDSTSGSTEKEREDSFFLYVGDTTLDQFNAYADKCAEAGFDVDFSRGDKTYQADSKDGYHLSLQYVGFNIMSISMSRKDDDGDDNSSAEKEENADNNTASSTSSQKEAVSSDAKDTSVDNKEAADNSEIRSDIKEAIDSYEAFINEYCEFMSSYDSSDALQLAQYASLIAQELEMTRKFEAIEDQELTDAEEDYYIEVQLRCDQKLLEVADKIN